MLQFFTQGWITPNLNSDMVILIPKIPRVDCIEKFHPLALANFKFKVITKVLVDKLAKVDPKIISLEQKGFIQGRKLKSVLASHMKCSTCCILIILVVIWCEKLMLGKLLTHWIGIFS